ncbi:hypothetical protein, partial [Pseudomonas putida]|uniref:hypothetical protein n=1 Tax=Pseudomonas putida TaxID=303 RepID=UPI001C624917
DAGVRSGMVGSRLWKRGAFYRSAAHGSTDQKTASVMQALPVKGYSAFRAGYPQAVPQSL